MAMVGVGVLPTWLAQSAYARETNGRRKILVTIFQRGAVDGLNVVVPHSEAAYYSMRPTIAIPRPHRGTGAEEMRAALDLDGQFGLHPALASLKPLWDQQHLAIIHATGSPDPTRSHFDAQDYMESGTPGLKATIDGWLNRAIALESDAPASPMRAVAMSAQIPRTLQGHVPAVAISNLDAFRLNGGVVPATITGTSFEAMYAQAADAVLRPAGQDTFEALSILNHLDSRHYQPAGGASYPRSPLGNSLRQLAQLIKADVGVEVAFADVGGWDHHVNEGNTQGQLANRLNDFGGSIAAFWTDLGDRAEDIVLVTMSEFGRTARENGNGGTDHGHANVMFVLGGPVHGGRVYGQWPGLEPEQLYEGRDLMVTTDFRAVLGETISKHLGVTSLAQVFPGYRGGPAEFRGFLRS
jgi:uncharacterized protein (DUF1501 family)